MNNLRQPFLDAIRAAESLSGARVAVHDISGALHWMGILKSNWDKALCHHDCAFCKHVRDLPGGRILCIQHDREECLNLTGQNPQWIRCPSGLEEMVFALRFEGQVLALVFLGQVRTARRENAPVLERFRLLGGDPKAFLSLHQALPMADAEQMERSALLLKMALESVIYSAGQETLRLYCQSSEGSLVHRVLRTLTPERILSVKELAAMFFVTPEQLNRAFRRECGMPLSEYIDNSRYSLACRLLREKRQSITTVGVNLGFQDHGTFLRWFRRLSGQSPQKYRDTQPNPEYHSAVSPQSRGHYVAQAQAYLQENFRSPIRVEALAAQLNITPDHLNRLFRRETGQTITQMLWSLRLSAAQEELTHTTTPIAHIAQQTGFSSVGAFCKRFKASTGLTPEAFRNKAKEE